MPRTTRARSIRAPRESDPVCYVCLEAERPDTPPEAQARLHCSDGRCPLWCHAACVAPWREAPDGVYRVEYLECPYKHQQTGNVLMRSSRQASIAWRYLFLALAVASLPLLLRIHVAVTAVLTALGVFLVWGELSTQPTLRSYIGAFMAFLSGLSLLVMTGTADWIGWRTCVFVASILDIPFATQAAIVLSNLPFLFEWLPLALELVLYVRMVLAVGPLLKKEMLTEEIKVQKAVVLPIY